jgi:DedD protein
MPNAQPTTQVIQSNPSANAQVVSAENATQTASNAQTVISSSANNADVKNPSSNNSIMADDEVTSKTPAASEQDDDSASSMPVPSDIPNQSKQTKKVTTKPQEKAQAVSSLDRKKWVHTDEEEIMQSEMAQSTSAITTPNAAVSAHAYVVQLGSFAEVSHANALEKALKAKGFKAYTEKMSTSKGELIRVLVGPEATKAKADALRDKINQAFHVNSVVLPFNPLAVKQST